MTQDQSIPNQYKYLLQGPPKGYQSVKDVSPTISATAKKLLSGNFGTITSFEADGKTYLARVEPHYHPPGYKGGPNGWHKGVSVYEKANGKTSTKSVSKNSILMEKIEKFLSMFLS